MNGAREYQGLPGTQALRRGGGFWASGLGLLVALAAVVAGTQGAGAANFTPPSGCRLEVTVQSRSCSVSQFYRCEGDPEGDQRSAVFGRNGLFHLSRIDAETRWVESSSPVTGIADRLVDQAESHASFSTLLETGRDDFDFWTESDTGERMRHVGHDVLTGEKVSIGGVELEKTEFQLTTTGQDGQVLIERQGQQFISRAFGRFYGGVEEQRDWTGQIVRSNDTPVQFIFPGQPGFGDTTPKFDCEQLMTAPLRRIQQS